MITGAAIEKLTRWVSKRRQFTRREAFLGTKGGSMRSVAAFESALAALLAEGVIALAAEQPSRGVLYIAQESHEFSTTAVLALDEPELQPSPVEIPTPEVPSPQPATTVVQTAPAYLPPWMARPETDPVTLSATAIRRTHRNEAITNRLNDIERRYGKTAGDNLRDADLHPTEIADLIRFGA